MPINFFSANPIQNEDNSQVHDEIQPGLTAVSFFKPPKGLNGT